MTPEDWAATYDDPAERGRGFVFRRGLELAAAACLRAGRSGQPWLDVGCGPGHLGVRLAAAGVPVIGIDRDEAMLEHARDRRKAHGAHRFAVLRADAASLPFKDASLAGVVATSLCGCLSDASSFLGEAARVLRPGGRVVLTFTNRDSLLLRLNGVIGQAERRITGRATDPARYRLYSGSEIDALLRRHGLRPDEIRFYNYVLNVGPALLPPSAVASRLLSGGRRSLLARNGLVVATRGR
jgi:SAM-dependent methyltransferase